MNSRSLKSRSLFASLLAAVFGMMVSNAVRGATVTLGWNADVSSGVAGYNIYFGGVSEHYTNMVNVGNVTTGTVTGLNDGSTYYFAVTAYAVTGLESPFSSEISYTIPATNSVTQTNSVPPTNPGPGKGHNKAKLRLSLNASKQATLTASAPAGYVYDVQASTDMKTWTTIGRVTASSAGTISFTDRKAKNSGRLYYRLKQTWP